MTKLKPKSESSPKLTAPAPAAPPRTTRAYLDGLEDRTARLLMEDEHGEWRTYHLPVAALPADVKEGSWLELVTRSILAPPEFDSRLPREKIGHNDGGENFSL